MKNTTMAACLALLAFALPTSCKADDGPVKITVTRNGYEPPVVKAKAGKPLTLVVTRTTDKTCATEFVLPEENLDVPLPLNQPVTITFTPKQAGTLRYSCGMHMLFGDIEVK